MNDPQVSKAKNSRYWLPFLLLLGGVAAIVISDRDGSSDVASDDQEISR